MPDLYLLNTIFVISIPTSVFTCIHLFEPLTVGIVKMWFGWFLWQLDNSRILIK